MLNWTNIVNGGVNPSYLIGPATFSGATPTAPIDFYCVPWLATGRNLYNDDGQPETVSNENSRTATSCYMVGLSEAIEITVSDGLPWQWRRVCIRFKGGEDLAGRLQFSPSFTTSAQNDSGYLRLLNTDPQQTANITDLLFKGGQNADWSDPMTAPLDSRRVSVMYDKTRSIFSGNEQGCIRKYKLWHKMGHNLVYDDDENGDIESSQPYSVRDNRGMGDVWIFDFIRPRFGAGTSNQFRFGVTSSLYWHER